MTKPITKSQAVAAAKAVIAAEPDTINPTVPGPNTASGFLCLYHQGRGRNIKRCIVGTVGWVLGLPTPPADGGGVQNLVEGVWEGLLTDAAAHYLNELQWHADGSAVVEYGPISWGEIPKSIVAGRV